VNALHGAGHCVVRATQAIIAGVVSIARTLGIQVLAEGVECEDEVAVLRATGIALFQGYHFAKPALMALPEVHGYPSSAVSRAIA
jgi:EAL domain-containing protein (putative c-di-GMP-specific phosphodiesterase class I)